MTVEEDQCATNDRGILARQPVRSDPIDIPEHQLPQPVQSALRPGDRVAVHSRFDAEPGPDGTIRGFNQYSVYDPQGNLVFDYNERTVDHSPNVSTTASSVSSATATATDSNRRPTDVDRGLQKENQKPLGESGRRLQKLLDENNKRLDSELQRETIREQRAKERETERQDFIAFPPSLEIAMIWDRWDVVKNKIRDHFERKRGPTYKTMEESGSSLMETAAENQRILEAAYIKNHFEDYHRIIQ